MKKLMIAMGAAALFGAVHADGVVSSQVVGYTTDALTADNFNMIAGAFNAVDGNGFQLNGNLVVANVTGGDNSAVADQIAIWNPADSSYETYYYYDDGDESGWSHVVTDNYFEDDYPTGLAAGSAFWYIAKANDAAVTTTFSGAIESSDDVTINLEGGQFNMIAGAYPINLQLNDASQVTWTGVSGGDNSAVADQISIWDAASSSYATYYYYDDGEEAGWSHVVSDNYFEVDYPNGLSVAKPFWYVAKDGEGKSVTFKKTF